MTKYNILLVEDDEALLRGVTDPRCRLLCMRGVRQLRSAC
jgi:hypothetical protein